MALDKLVDSTLLNEGLTSIADAIRAKGSTSESLSFPVGFVSAISDLSSGGIDWSAMAEPIKSAKHIYSGISIDSQEAFISAINIKNVGENAVLLSEFSTYMKFTTYANVFLASGRMSTKTIYCAIPVGIRGKIVTVGIASRSTAIHFLQLTSIGSESITLKADLYNPNMMSMLISSVSHSYVLSLYYKSAYDPYDYGSSIAWYHSLTEDTIYFRCTNTFASFSSGYSGLYWNASPASNVVLTSDTVGIPVYAFLNNTIVQNVNGLSLISSIGSHAFEGCLNLTGTLWMNSCKSIGAYAFKGCVNVSRIYAPECIHISTYTYYNCGILSINDEDFESCTSIGSYAFASCLSLSAVNMQSVTSIGSYAFTYCSNLASISLPNCDYIYERAFFNCSKLESISLPSCSNIGNAAFASCTSLSFFSAPLCETLGQNVFESCVNLKRVSFSLVTSLGSAVFSKCYSLSEVDIPLCTYVGLCAFYGCSSLISANFPSCSKILTGAFSGCINLTEINMPLAESVAASAFYHCSKLTRAFLPSCSYIGTNAFDGCQSLSEVVLNVCSSIGMSAFAGCSSLYKLYLLSTSVASVYNSSVFISTPFRSTVSNSAKIYVPIGMKSLYDNANVWVYFKTKIEETDSVPT